MSYSDDAIRRILIEHALFLGAAELCAKWEVTPYRLRQWKQRIPNWRFAWTLEELALAALYPGGWHRPADLAEYMDWRNHARYSDGEIRDLLRTLEAQGRATRDGDRWAYRQLEPPFIF